MKINYLLLLSCALLTIGCNKEQSWPAPPEVPEELVFEEFPEEVNVVKKSDIENTALDKDIEESSPVIYDEWGCRNNNPENTVICVADDPDQGKVLKFTNGIEPIGSANYNQAYIGQRVMAKAKPAMYKLSFKAKAEGEGNSNGIKTLRTYILSTGEQGVIVKNFFVGHHSENPLEITPDNKKYTMYCKHVDISGEWQTYTRYINMSRTTNQNASAIFNTSKIATDEDLKAFVICFQASTENTTVYIDDIEFTLLPEPEPEEPLLTPGAGVNVLYDSGFDKADLTKPLVVSPLQYGMWGKYDAEIPEGMSFVIADDENRGKVVKIEVGAKTVPSSYSFRAYIGQRVYAIADDAFYKFSFKAKKTTAKGTVRIFVAATAEDGTILKRIFPMADFATGPEDWDRKYNLFCAHLDVTDEWVEYTKYFHMGKALSGAETDGKLSGSTFNELKSSTETDKEKYVVCLSASAQDSVVLIDDVDFSLVEAPAN